MTESDPVPFPLRLSQIRGDVVIFTGAVLPPRVSDSTNERMTPSGEAEWPRRALLRPMAVRGPRTTSMSRCVASSNWKRRPEMRRNEGESVNARRMPTFWLEGRRSPNKKGVYLSIKRYIEQIEFDATHSFFSLSYRRFLLFDIWSIMKIKTYTALSNVFNDPGNITFVTLTK